MWAELAAVTVAFTFGIFCHWYLSLRRNFLLHLRFPNGQVLAFGIPVNHWQWASGDTTPLCLDLHDDGKPPATQTTQMVPL